ncbi:hypothetical protein Scep_027673 [Stephania cephalantha]|uniref:Uncharacterized protein n=1 Tax=Stephania cephalantha TaxID=152367 RepID=A0AAP0HLB4_9MAGN
MDAADDDDLVEGASRIARRPRKERQREAEAKEGRQSVQRERRTEKIVHLTTEIDDEDLQVGVGEARGGEEESKPRRGGEAVGARKDRRMGAREMRGGGRYRRERKMEKISNSVRVARRSLNRWRR